MAAPLRTHPRRGWTRSAACVWLVGLLAGPASAVPTAAESNIAARALAARMVTPSGAVPVAIFDTGIGEADRVRLGATVHIEPNDRAFVDDPSDPEAEHGSLVAQALRRSTNLTSASGPLHVPIVDVRVTGSYGSGGNGTVYPMWGELMNASATAGARVANFSFVSDDIGLCGEIAAHPEIAMVAAAGNAGVDISGRRVYPAACPGMITVTGMDPDDRTPTGNVGSVVDFAVQTPYVIDRHGLGWGGTSMGAGYASGVVATILAINPGLTPAAVEEVLCRTVRPVPALAAPVTRCGGIVDEAAAMNAAVDGSPTTLGPELPATAIDGAQSRLSVHLHPVAKRRLRRSVTTSRLRSSASGVSRRVSRRLTASSKRGFGGSAGESR